ncbi:hypothetical protein ACFIOY_35110 [Bradyrhizobium sp. TZ2]
MSRERGDNLRFLQLAADRFEMGDGGVAVFAGSETFKSGRLWIAAGVVNSPNILARSVSPDLRRAFISDHVICYAGQIERRGQNHSPSRWKGHRTDSG